MKIDLLVVEKNIFTGQQAEYDAITTYTFVAMLVLDKIGGKLFGCKENKTENREKQSI